MGKVWTQDSQIQSIGKDKIQKVIPSLVKQITTTYYGLGGLVMRVRDEGLFIDWEGVEYASFDEWCEQVLSFGTRKAQYLITIYKAVRDLQPSAPLKERLLNLGWVKVGQVIRVADTAKGLKKWVKVAEESSLRDLQNKVRVALAKTKASDGDDDLVGDELPTTIVRKFKLDEVQNQSFDKAHDLIKTRFPSAKEGDIVGMLCTSYLASHVNDDEGGIAVELSYILKQLESYYGVRLKIVKPATGSPSKGKKKAGKKAG